MPGLRRDPRTGPGGEQRAEEGDPSESGSQDFPQEAHTSLCILPLLLLTPSLIMLYPT